MNFNQLWSLLQFGRLSMFTLPIVNYFKQCVFLQENVQHETNLGLDVFFQINFSIRLTLNKYILLRPGAFHDCENL